MRGSLRVLALSAIAGMVIVSAVPARRSRPACPQQPRPYRHDPYHHGQGAVVGWRERPRCESGSAPGKPFLVMLDTGSVGLRVFPGGWSGDVNGADSRRPRSRSAR